MASNGVDWLSKFGKPPDKMDEGEWRMAVAAVLSEMAANVKSYTKLIVGVGTIIIGLLATFIGILVHHVEVTSWVFSVIASLR